MPSERTQRRIDATLDEAEAAFAQRDWALVAELARAALAMDPDNEDVPPLLRAGRDEPRYARNHVGSRAHGSGGRPGSTTTA